MLSHVKHGLPTVPNWPFDFDALRYFIDSENQIGKIKKPSTPFQFFMTSNERYNDIHREEMHACIRDQETKLSYIRLYLPHLNDKKPLFEQLNNAKRLIVIFDDSTQGLGIWAYRMVGNEEGNTIRGGSCVGFVKDIQNMEWSGPGDILPCQKVGCGIDVSKDDDVAVIILNAGTHPYSDRLKTTLTLSTWNALPGPTAIHTSIKTVPDTLITNPEFGNENAEISPNGLSDGGHSTLCHIDANWDLFKGRIQISEAEADFDTLIPTVTTNSDSLDPVEASFGKPRPSGPPPPPPLNTPSDDTGQRELGEDIADVLPTHFILPSADSAAEKPELSETVHPVSPPHLEPPAPTNPAAAGDDDDNEDDGDINVAGVLNPPRWLKISLSDNPEIWDSHRESIKKKPEEGEGTDGNWMKEEKQSFPSGG